jgi:hypothetical protein
MLVFATNQQNLQSFQRLLRQATTVLFVMLLVEASGVAGGEGLVAIRHLHRMQ